MVYCASGCTPAGLDPDRLLLMVAVLAYGMHGMQRGGQIADLEERDLLPRWMFPPALDGADPIPAGLAAEFRVVRHKRDPSGQHPMSLLIEQGAGPICPVRLLDLYLWRSRGVRLRDWRSDSGRRLFSLHGAPLDTSDLRLFVRVVAAHAGLSGYFGSHSLRISGACYAILAGRSWEEVQAIGGWLSDAVMAYLRTVVAAVAGCSAAMGF